MADLKSIVNKWQTFMIENNGRNALVLESHDQGRAISRFASDKPKWREIASKMVATFLGFQSGTVFIYQGQELTQANVPESWTIDLFRDIETLNHWKDLGESSPSNVRQRQVAMSQYKIKYRDNARTPMQRDGSRNAEEAHAITLFEKKLRKQSDNKNAAELAGALEFMLLAIVQAVVYIS